MFMRSCTRHAASSAAAAALNTPQPWLSATNNIADMTARHESLWFKVPDDYISTLGLKSKHLLSVRLYKHLHTFSDLYLMARRPMLDLVHYANQMGPDRPHVRMLIAGEFGTGKQTCLLQMMLWGVQQGCCVVHVPHVLSITRGGTPYGVPEVTVSQYNKKLDTPFEATNFLNAFKTLNTHLHDTFVSLPLTKTYTFTEFESLKEGEPLMSLIDFGIARGVFATDCIGCLFRELKHYANTAQLKLLVTLNEANSLFFSTSIRRSDLYMTPANQLAIVKHLTDLISDEWTNGAVVAALRSSEFRRAQYKGGQVVSETPKELLGIEGVHCFDPFLSFSTANYSLREARSAMEFYKFKEWISPDGAVDSSVFNEVYAITAGNPWLFDRYMGTLF